MKDLAAAYSLNNSEKEISVDRKKKRKKKMCDGLAAKQFSV